MQVFIIGSPLETAMALDPKRLRKQIIECEQILTAIISKSGWSNHPCVLQYRGYDGWIYAYQRCLAYYLEGDMERARFMNFHASNITPVWHTQEYFDQMKRRLYTKDPEHYKQWADLGESQENWYWSEKEGVFIKYVNGKRIE